MSSQLPPEVVQHIFSLRRYGDLVLSLKKRLQAMAVCRAWHEFLDPKRWPVEDLHLDGTHEADLVVALWVYTKQPLLRSVALTDFTIPQLLLTLTSSAPWMALEDLILCGKSRVLRDSLAVIHLFPSLTRLYLNLDGYRRDGTLDLAVLGPLSALRQFECHRWQHVELTNPTLLLLRQLTYLDIQNCDTVVIDAELPSLLELVVHTTNSVRLGGERLHLPQLTRLLVEDSEAVAVDWAAVPQLAALSTEGCQSLNTDTLAALGRLTSLSVAYDWQTKSSFETANEVLQAAPPSVQRLSIRGLREGWLPPLQRLPRLTSLTCDRPAIIPQLGALPLLQHLRLESHSAALLTLEHAELLAGKTSLRRLCFTVPLDPTNSARLQRVQALRKLLPVDCTLEQPML